MIMNAATSGQFMIIASARFDKSAFLIAKTHNFQLGCATKANEQ